MAIDTISINEYLSGLENGTIEPLHTVEKILYGRINTHLLPSNIPSQLRPKFKVVKAVHP